MTPAWIGVDWGTTALRAWAFGPDGDVLAEASSTRGMGTLDPAEFEPALLDLVAPWLCEQPSPSVQVIACGMVGARQGWREAPYRAVPCTPLADALQPVEPTDPRLAVAIIPGLSQSEPPDVMRGEETQIAGYLAEIPDFDGVLCLPGTHTKWAQMSAGEVVSFQTCLTGELFALLGSESVLRHSVRASDLDMGAFQDAVTDAMTAPHRITTWLFGIRAASLLSEQTPEIARARLSGLLIGLELAGSKPYWLGQDVAIIGAGELTTLYAAALNLAGVTARVLDGAESTVAGLRAARDLFRREAGS